MLSIAEENTLIEVTYRLSGDKAAREIAHAIKLEHMTVPKGRKKRHQRADRCLRALDRIRRKIAKEESDNTSRRPLLTIPASVKGALGKAFERSFHDGLFPNLAYKRDPRA